jgi:hypothetical protein
MADGKTYWPIPKDLGTLHDVIIAYAVRIQAVAAAKQEKTSEGPISRSALFTLHRIGIVTHCSIRVGANYRFSDRLKQITLSVWRKKASTPRRWSASRIVKQAAQQRMSS